MLDFIMWIVMIVIGAKLLITPADQLLQMFPQMPSTTAAKIIGGILIAVGIVIVILRILAWLGKI